MFYSLQTHLVNQNLNNTRVTEKVCKDNNKMQIKYNNLKSKLNNISSISKSSKISESLQRDEVNEIYEFTHQFNGSSGIMALTFRENVKNYVKFVKDNLKANNYLESRVITRIVKGLIGDAKVKYSQRQGDRFNSLDAFYKWFDTEFQLSDLRSELYIKLKNWQIDPNTSKLNIVQEYQRTLNLFNLTETITAQTILDLTQLTTPVSINAIIKGLEYVHPRVHSFIDNRFKLQLKMPNSFSQLEEWIKDACVYIETSDRNSNKQQDNPTKMNSANTVLTNDYSHSHNSQSRNEYTNSYETYNNGYSDRYSNNRNYHRNSATNYNREYHHNKNSNYGYDNNNSNNEQYQSCDGHFNDYNDTNLSRYNNNNNSNYGYNNDNSNEEQYQSHQGQHGDYTNENSTRYDTDNNNQDQCYDDHNNYDYGYFDNNSNNNQYQSYHYQEYGDDDQFDYYDYDRETNRQYEQGRNEYDKSTQKFSFRKRSYATPKYKQFECDDCGIWGHAYVDCEWIHRQFPKLLIEYANMKKFHCKDSNVNNSKTNQNSNINGDKHVNNKHTDKNNDNEYNK